MSSFDLDFYYKVPVWMAWFSFSIPGVVEVVVLPRSVIDRKIETLRWIFVLELSRILINL